MGKLAQALQAANAKISALEQDRAIEARKLEIEAFEAETNRMRVESDDQRRGSAPPEGGG